MICPLCRRPTAWNANPWRPFCSERCQLIDLGTWASEGYRLPAQSPNLLPPADESDEIEDEVVDKSVDETPNRRAKRSDTS